jgi:hypothetical protein
MLLSILDQNLERVGFLDNEENTQGLEFYDDIWSRYLETGSATFDFSVDKKNLDLDTHNRRVYQTLNERSFVSFHDNGRAYLFNIMKTVEDENSITCSCENLNLELLNEYANAYRADKAYTFEEYCKKLDLLDFAALKLGINEISDQKRTLEWTGQDTKLKRLISLANNFDAEIAFETYLNDDSSLKVFRLNVFKEHDDTHQGVGARRDDIILAYDDNIESITRTIDKTTIFNMIHPTGSDRTVTHKVTKTRTVNKTVTVSSGGATNTENALRNIESRKGQRVGTGQCYALSALYSSLLGGPGLGGGVTGISGRIGAGIAASNIGTDYRWGAFGWGVEAGSVSKAKAGAIVNIKANYGSPFWTGIYGHTAIIKSINGSNITVLEQNYAGRMYIVENTYNLNAYMAGVQTLCYPPELVAGKTVGGQAVTKTVPVQETYTEDVQETVKTVIDSSKYKEWKNSDGEVEFYVKNGNIYAPLSQKLYPAVLNGKVIGDNWIRKDISVETTDEAVLEATALKTLKAGCYPAVTYEVKGDADLEPGDTVKVRDDQFFPTLLLEMRASEVHRSFSNPDEDRTVFTNFKELENKVDANLLARMEEMAEAAVPYTIKISSDNGTTFKNSEGESLFKANLYKGEKLLASDVTWRWALDGNVTVAMQYLARASTIKDTAVLTVSAYIGNNEVATTEITLTNVNDGADGAKGDKGEKGDTGPQGPKGEQGIAGATGETGAQGPKGNDGKTSYIHIKYAPVANPSDSQITDTPNAYIGVYTDYNSADSTKASAYTWSKWQGEDGAQGIQGPKGTDGKTSYIHFAYANSADGKTNFSTTYFSGALYVGTLTDYNSADSTTYSAYTWSRLKGDKGDKGERGPQGIQGLQGPKGDQGIQGVKGADGKTQYTHIAYADNATGGGFSQTDQTKAYIGMYVDFNATDSNDPTKYKWSKWKGDKGDKGAQGIAGKAGADGKTPYLHIAYANSADGKKDFSTSNTDNKRYLGTYTDYTQADSTDPTKYKWVDMVGTVEVSGRNLWIQSKATGGFIEEILPDNHITGQKKCYRIPNNKELAFNIEPDFSSRLYQKVTFSAWVKYENVVQGANSWNMFNCFKHAMVRKNSSTGATTSTDYTTLEGFAGTSDWKYITYTYDYAANKSYDQLKTIIIFNLEGAKSGTAWVTGVMVQFGNVATGHVWAPEDIQADIDSKADSALTQEQLNALEAKRLQMEVELKAKATLEQVSELETFINNLKKEDLDGRQKIIEITKAIEERVKDIEPIMEYSQKLQFIDTYITQGNGGMIIGKNDSTTKVVVTPDRISFQSGGSEVAYISQRMLHIDNGVFTMSLQLGHYITRAHPKNEYVNATYFVK